MAYPWADGNQLNAADLNAEVQPVCLVCAKKTNITSITSGSYQDISVPEIYDSHSAYDGTTFTVPAGKSGTYFIYWACRVASTESTIHLTVSVNGVDDTTEEDESSTIAGESQNRVVYASMKTLNAGDTVVARANLAAGSTIIQPVKFNIHGVGRTI